MSPHGREILPRFSFGACGPQLMTTKPDQLDGSHWQAVGDTHLCALMSSQLPHLPLRLRSSAHAPLHGVPSLRLSELAPSNSLPHSELPNSVLNGRDCMVDLAAGFSSEA